MSDLDILFVHPGSRNAIYQALGNNISAVATPVWCGMAASVARDAGLRVAILDCEAEDLSAFDAAKRIIKVAPKLAALVVYGHQPSASAQNLAYTVVLRDEVKRLGGGKQRQLLMGGAVSTLWPSLIAVESDSAETGVYVARGDGVWTAIELAKPQTSLRDVPSLAWRNRFGDVETSTKSHKLDFVPAVAYGLMDASKYRAHNHHAFTGPRAPYASVYASLGCPYSCRFCCIQAPFKDGMHAASGGVNKYLMKPVDVVVSEIEWLVHEWGARTIRFDDEMFGANPKWLNILLDKLVVLNAIHRLNLWAYARVDQKFSDATLAKMRKAGFRWLCYGIESAADDVREDVNKGGYDMAEIERVVRRTEAAGIEVLANYIFGLEYDTITTMELTLQLAMRLNTAWANFYTCMAYPGSALYDAARTDAPNTLPSSWLGYSQHAYETQPLPTRTLTARDVLAFRDEAHRRYFERDEYKAMVSRKFGASALAIVDEMNEVRLKRELLGDAR